jgi:hypothetical protein
LFGHSQPFVQSSQQADSHLQFGQSLQQSFEQQEPSFEQQVASLAGVPAAAGVE